jgi:hypothetical protein
LDYNFSSQQLLASREHFVKECEIDWLGSRHSCVATIAEPCQHRKTKK